VPVRATDQQAAQRRVGAPVVVVGAGVAGLTTAACLAEAGFSVQVLTKDPPLSTTSATAGAIWGPYLGGPRKVTVEWGRRTLGILSTLAQSPAETGVRILTGMEAARRPTPAPPWSRQLDSFTACPPQDLPPDFAVGWTFSAPVIDMPRYLDYLMRRLARAGGTVKHTHVRALGTVDPAPSVLVNCTGAEAAGFVPDAGVLASRGQTVVVANPGVRRFFVEECGDDRDQLYVLPHGSTVVLGATLEPGRSDRRPNRQDSARILSRCAAVEPALCGARIIAERVGVRPQRDSVRLEVDRSLDYPVVHNYGHGGAGVSLSWGCALHVRALAAALCKSG